MTREEIKNTPELVDFMLDKSVIADSREKLRKRLEEVCNLAIKALEQETILDKIRAEIKVLSPEPTAYDVVDGNPVKDAIWETLIEVDKIIDKYKVESEET